MMLLWNIVVVVDCCYGMLLFSKCCVGFGSTVVVYGGFVAWICNFLFWLLLYRFMFFVLTFFSTLSSSFLSSAFFLLFFFIISVFF